MCIEHVNLSVADLDRSVAFYREMFDFELRWRGTNSAGRPEAHVGDERCYLALFQAERSGKYERDYADVGFNHFGFAVDDLARIKDRLTTKGITPHLEADYNPGRRLYFLDPDGIEVEAVEYDGEGR